MEDEVTNRVEAEFALDDWKRQCGNLDRELAAIRATRWWRSGQQLRSAARRIVRRG